MTRGCVGVWMCECRAAAAGLSTPAVPGVAAAAAGPGTSSGSTTSVATTDNVYTELQGDDTTPFAAQRQGSSAASADHIPSRPPAQRMEHVAHQHARDAFGAAAAANDVDDTAGGGGGAYTAGFGFFPSLFGLQFQTFGLDRRPRTSSAAHGGGRVSAEDAHQLFLSRVLVALAIAVLVMLLIL